MSIAAFLTNLLAVKWSIGTWYSRAGPIHRVRCQLTVAPPTTTVRRFVADCADPVPKGPDNAVVLRASVTYVQL